MPFAIDKSVDIELFIEGRRLLLFRKINSGLAPSAIGSSRSDILGCNPCISDGFDNLPIASGGSVYVRKNIFCLYTVIDSFWDEVESKRVFEVEHLSTKYFYYAFMLDDYIVCPAFLARSLEISKYACLNVICDNNYPYIFVKTESYDLKLNIAEDHFNFHGEHVFKLSLEQEKVFDLTFENTLLNAFIMPRKPPDKLIFEWNKTVCDQKGIPKRSKLHPNYIYIPEETFPEFRKKHRTFLRLDLFWLPNA
jgi:hypothetical protein